MVDMHPVPSRQVAAVNHDMGVRDPAGVVVVVDDSDLVVGEESHGPLPGQLPQGFEVDEVLGVRRQHEILECPRRAAAPRLVVPEPPASRIHLDVPHDGGLELLGRADVLPFVPRQVEEVPRKRAASLLQVPPDPSRRPVPADRLQDGHGQAPTRHSASMRASS